MKTSLLMAMLSAVCMPTLDAAAGVAGSISFQGRLTDDLGAPLANGLHALDVFVYDEPTGGTPIGSVLNIPVTLASGNGVASTALDVDADWFAGVPRFLGLTVDDDDDDPIGDEIMPRIQLHAVPYALRALSLPATAIINVQGATVAGDATVLGGIFVGGPSQFDSSLKLTNPGTLLYSGGNPEGVPGADAFRLREDPDFFGSSLDAIVFEKTDGSSSPDGGVAFVNTGSNGVPQTSLVIRGNGNVGIGTNAPVAPLHVVGSVRVNSGSGSGAQLLTDANGAGELRANGGPGNLGKARLIVGDNGGEMLLVGASGASTRVSAYIESEVGQLRLGGGAGGLTQLTGDGLITLGNDVASSVTLNGQTGRITTQVLEITQGSDIAEPFDASSSGGVQPGMVMVIDPDRPGDLRLSRDAYDTKVAGIVSGANGINTGLLLRQTGTIADGTHPVALVGKVWAWCDADAGGSIRPGDLLTTSTTPGHAMKVSNHASAQGAILGKAMTRLDEGAGLVLVLVTLQ